MDDDRFVSNQIDPSQTLFDGVDPAQDAPAQDPATAANQKPAWLDDALTAVRDIVGSTRQDPATSAQAAPPRPSSWWESLSAEQREKLNEQSLLNPAQTNAFIAQNESQFARQQTLRDADPILNGQAGIYVDLFKGRKQRGERYFAQIEPLFDRMLAGLDLRPLVNMTAGARDSELDMRWNAAKSQVLEKVLSAPGGSREPSLTSSNAPSGAAPPPATAMDGDPMLAAMASTYGFTPEQKAALEAAASERE